MIIGLGNLVLSKNSHQLGANLADYFFNAIIPNIQQLLGQIILDMLNWKNKIVHNTKIKFLF